ncbi:immunoglobulin iota chain-like [Solea senegalensis]|nr:immunoglobulin iota chain-like [Solea senegalensis]
MLVFNLSHGRLFLWSDVDNVTPPRNKKLPQPLSICDVSPCIRIMTMAHNLVRFTISTLWLQVHCQYVTQHPAISWSYVSTSVEMNCSHNRDVTHNQMDWYKQRPGESMTIVVYTTSGGKPVNQTKYSAIKDNIESGALTVKNLQPEDSAVYFCAVSKHSGVKSMSC